jgi:uncharacterized SAM-binding protein YcdF (DUF218 family)
MIYLLKFGAGFILPPGIFFLGFIILAVLLWQRKETAIASGIIGLTFVFYLLSTNLVAESLLGNLESLYDPPADPTGDVIIMLGGGATQDTPDLDGAGGLSGSPANRLITTVRLYNRLHVPILVSGGQVYADSGREAVIAKRMLLSLGVKESDILVEDQSLTTRQNAKFSKEILKKNALAEPILVTSAFHMQRAVLDFQKEHVAVQPFPTDYMVNREHAFHYNKLSPSAWALQANAMVLQEKLRTLVTKYLEN